MPRVPANNFLFEQVTINGEEDDGTRSNPMRASVTEQGGNKSGLEKLKGPPSYVKDRLRAMQRIWSAMTKYVASQCANGRTVDLPLAGKFKLRKSDKSGDDNKPKYMFMPHLDFLGSGHFKYPENEFNVSPFSKGSVGFQSGLVTVSLSSLAAVCSFDRESVASGMKSIFIKFVSDNSNFCV